MNKVFERSYNEKISQDTYRPQESWMWTARTSEGPIYHKSSIVKKIVRESESPLVERILIGTGEIVLKVEDDRLDIYSIRYEGSNRKITKHISKELIKGYHPEQALQNAKRGITGRISEIEVQKRERKLQEEIRRYFQIHTLEEGRKITAQERALMTDVKGLIEKNLNSLDTYAS